MKYVTLAEEYLADHFPTFPVLPGVMMLEAATQAAGGCSTTAQLARSMAVLKEAQNVKYGNFVAPGGTSSASKSTTSNPPNRARPLRPPARSNNTTAVQARMELAALQPRRQAARPRQPRRQDSAHTRSRFDVLTATPPESPCGTVSRVAAH